MEKLVLRVGGMSCEHCARAVAQAAGGLPGVRKVAVDVKKGLVSLRHDPAKAPVSAIQAAIEDAGYTAGAASA
ncbi:MAG: copper chaperone CopZ [Treponematales bacterium]